MSLEGESCKSDRVALFEKLHFHELEVRERITSKVQHSLSILIVLTGIVLYLLRSFRQGENGDASALSWFFLSGAAICCVFMAVFVIRGLWGAEYREVDTAEVIDGYLDKLVETYAKYDVENGTNELAVETEKFLRGMYMRSATANANTNDLRGVHVHRANAAAIWAAAFSVLAFIVLVFGRLEKDGTTAVSISAPVAVEVRSLPAPDGLSQSNQSSESSTEEKP